MLILNKSNPYHIVLKSTFSLYDKCKEELLNFNILVGANNSASSFVEIEIIVLFVGVLTILLESY